MRFLLLNSDFGCVTVLMMNILCGIPQDLKVSQDVSQGMWQTSKHISVKGKIVVKTRQSGNLKYHSGGNSYRPENIYAELISLSSYRPASPVELIR